MEGPGERRLQGPAERKADGLMAADALGKENFIENVLWERGGSLIERK